MKVYQFTEYMSTTCKTSSGEVKDVSFAMPAAFLLDKRAQQIRALLENAGPNELLLPTPQVGLLLGISPQTLELWRSKGVGSEFIPLGPRAVRYSLAALRKFIAARVTTTTNSAIAGPGRPKKPAQS